MIGFATIDANGIPRSGGMRRDLPEGTVALPAPWTTIDLPHLIWIDGAWALRPQLTIAASRAGAVVPEDAPGLTIDVIDNGDGSALDLPRAAKGTVVLPADCDVTVIARADLPWRGAELRIVRGAGSSLVAVARLAQARSTARALFNDTVGRARLALITDIPGQQNIYAAKEDEARAYLALPVVPATLAGFPLMAAEVGLTAPDAYQLAQLWLNMATLWRQVAAATEGLRMGLGAALAAAPDEAAIDAAVTSFTEALTALMRP